MFKLLNLGKATMISVLLLVSNSMIAWGQDLAMAEKDGLLVPLQKKRDWKLRRANFR